MGSALSSNSQSVIWFASDLQFGISAHWFSRTPESLGAIEPTSHARRLEPQLEPLEPISFGFLPLKLQLKPRYFLQVLKQA
jgi:hypothetical protein